MKVYVLLLAVVLGLTSCDNGSSGSGDTKDSVSTDSLTNPSSNPEIEVDTVAKQMNLDSADLHK